MKQEKMKAVLVIVLVALATAGLYFTKSSSQAADAGLPVDQSDGYYEVASIADLETMQQMIEGGVSSGTSTDLSRANYKLVGDIVCGNGEQLYSIGETPNGPFFKGIFDGKGHKISGLNIVMDPNHSSDVGLFSVLEGATVKELAMEDCHVVWKRSDSNKASQPVSVSNIGLIAGRAENARVQKVTLNDCTIEPKLPDGSKVTGGVNLVVGSVKDSTLSEVKHTNTTSGNTAAISFPSGTDTSGARVGLLDRAITGSGGSFSGSDTSLTPVTPTQTPTQTSTPVTPTQTATPVPPTQTAAPVVTPTETATPAVPPTDQTTPPAQPGDPIEQGALTYEVGEGGTIAVSGASADLGEHLVIPDTITQDGVTYRVTRILKNAFRGNNRIRTVKIGKYIEAIDAYAFRACKKLRTVTIGVRKKGKRKAEKESPLSLCEVINITIGTGVFQSCSNLKKVIINCEVRIIGNSAFAKCPSLSSVIVYSKQLQTVGNQALKGVHDCRISVLKVKLKVYKKLFKNKGQGKKVVVAKL